MPKTFQVPVWFNLNHIWFNIEAETQDEAWHIVVEQMMGKHVDYVVEEPVEISDDNEE
jgi:hypothetical protein